MASATGFGLGDTPFTSNGFGSFGELSRSVAASTSSAATAGGGSGSSSAGGNSVFDNLLGAIGNGVARIADFGTQLFIFDELTERGQTASTTNTTSNTAATGTASTSFLKGVPNEVLLIGVAVVVVLLILFVKGK